MPSRVNRPLAPRFQEFVQIAQSRLEFLVQEFDAGPPEVTQPFVHTIEVTYRTPTTGVRVALEDAENQVYAYLIRLRDGDLPSYLYEGADWAYVDALLARHGRAMVGKSHGELLAVDDLKSMVDAYAEGVRQLAPAILHGDFSEFDEISVGSMRDKLFPSGDLS